MAKKTNICAVFFLFVFALTAVLTETGKLDGINTAFRDWVYRLETPAMTAILKGVTYAGEWFVYVPAALMLILVPKLRITYGIPAAVILAVSASLNTALKLCFAVPRPDIHRLISETGYGFPSGHAMNGTAFIGICSLLFALYSSVSKTRKLTVLCLSGLFILSVGFSRIYLGVHNLSDIISGYAMGLFLCLSSVSIISHGNTVNI